MAELPLENPLALEAARAQSRARHSQKRPGVFSAPEAKRIEQQYSQLLADREDELKLRSTFPEPTQRAWVFGSVFRGERTSKKLAAQDAGLAYELALAALQHADPLDKRTGLILNTRFEVLRKTPEDAAWSNEREILSVVLTRSSFALPPAARPLMIEGEAAEYHQEAPPPREEKKEKKTKPKTDYEAPRTQGKKAGELLFSGGHWWLANRAKKWDLVDPEPGLDPIEDMRAFINERKAQLEKQHGAFSASDEGENFRIDNAGKIGRTFFVYRNGQLEPMGAEIRRFLGFPSIDMPVVSDQYANTVKKELAELMAKTNGINPSHNTNPRSELKFGQRMVLNRPKVNLKLPLIWSGDEWQPVDNELREKLGLEPVATLFDAYAHQFESR